MDDDRRERLLRASCDRHLAWHGDRSVTDLLAEWPAGIDADRYGDGGVVTELEAMIADLLGKPAAVFMPTGTMAQQIALRIHADQTGRWTVLLHPTAHPVLWEGQAAERLHGLTLRPVGTAQVLMTRTDLEAVAEAPAALLVELPQRELGAALPPWEDVLGLVDWARDQGARVHLDGARLWQCGPAYGRSYADLAAPFDSVYVSFYKDLGAIAGACLAGDVDLVAEAREWRHRHGGKAFALWPFAASALGALRRRLDRLPAYLERARAIGAAVADVDGIELSVDPPRTSLMHLNLRGTEAAIRARTTELAANEGLWTFNGSYPTDRAGWRRVELTVGDATLELSVEEAVAAIVRLVEPAASTDPADQLVEVVDADGAVTAVVTRRRIRAEQLRHRCAYVAVVTSADELVVHQRSTDKDVYPGWWDVAFGGICDVGERWEPAARRELAEEAGIEGVDLEDLGPVTWDGPGPALVGRVYLARHDGPVSTPDGEVVAVDRIPLDDVESWVADHEVCTDSVEAVLPVVLARTRSHPGGQDDA